MDISYITSNLYLPLGIGCALYLVFYWLFRQSIVSISDPLNLGLGLVSFYLAGALLIPTAVETNLSYLYVVILVFLYILAGAFSSKSRAPLRVPQLRTDRSSQLIFTSILTTLALLNVVINQVFGVMPLFQGTGARAQYGSVLSPTLYSLSPDIATLILLIFLLTKARRVRTIAAIGLCVSVISTVLGGSKSALFSLLTIFCMADYVLHLKLATSQIQSTQIALRKRIGSTRRAAIVCALGIAILLPTYMVTIGAVRGEGGGAAYRSFSARLFDGFDGLAVVASTNIDLTSVQDVNISGFYFYPILKKMAHAPEFQSAGSYLIYLLTGSYTLATSGLNPNSTLAIELLISNGSIVLSGILIALASAAVFRLRVGLLRRSRLRILDLVLWTLVVCGPFSVLIDGAYFIVRSYELVGLYLAINFLVNMAIWFAPGRKYIRLL